MTRRRLLMADALAELIDHRGKTPKKLGGDWTDNGHRVVSALNIKGSRVDANDHHYISDEMYVKWMKVPLKAGDVLLTSEAPTGEVAFLEEPRAWALGQRLFGLRGKSDVLDGRYLYYALRGGDARHQLMSRATGTTVSGIRQSELVKIELELPSIDAQRAVAATLGSLDDKIESNRRAIALAWSLLSAEHSALASNGVATALGNLVSLEYGKSLPATARDPGNVPVYGSGGITGWHSEALIDGPAVIVGRKGSVGEIYWSHSSCYPIDTTFFVRPSGDLPLLSAYFVVAAAGFKEMNSDSAVPGLNRQAALGVQVQCPPLNDVRRWADSRVPLVDRVQGLEHESSGLARLRDALMPELLSGRIRVPEAADLVQDAVV